MAGTGGQHKAFRCLVCICLVIAAVCAYTNAEDHPQDAAAPNMAALFEQLASDPGFMKLRTELLALAQLAADKELPNSAGIAATGNAVPAVPAAAEATAISAEASGGLGKWWVGAADMLRELFIGSSGPGLMRTAAEAAHKLLNGSIQVSFANCVATLGTTIIIAIAFSGVRGIWRAARRRWWSKQLVLGPDAAEMAVTTMAPLISQRSRGMPTAAEVLTAQVSEIRGRVSQCLRDISSDPGRPSPAKLQALERLTDELRMVESRLAGMSAGMAIQEEADKKALACLGGLAEAYHLRLTPQFEPKEQPRSLSIMQQHHPTQRSSPRKRLRRAKKVDDGYRPGASILSRPGFPVAKDLMSLDFRPGAVWNWAAPAAAARHSSSESSDSF